MGRIILNNEEYTGSSGGSVNDVTVNGSSVVNAQGVAEVTVPDELADLADDSTHRTVTDTEKTTWSAKVSDNPTFTEASTRANIASGESFATILGKIKKFFTDLKTVAFTGAYSDLSGTENVAVKNANNRFSQSQIIDAKNGTVSTDGYSYISVGNGTPSGTSGNSFGIVEIYGKGSKYVDLKASNVTANRNIELPDKGGTVALTSDIPDISTKVTKSGDTMTGQLTIQKENTTTSSVDSALSLGNNIPNGTEGCSYGKIRLWGDNAYRTDIFATGATANRNIYFPDNGGTVALTSDIQIGHEMGNTAYESNDTHYLKLCTITLGNYYEYVSLLITSSFWGNQHGSADIINIQASKGSSSTDTYATVQRFHLAGSGGNGSYREFYYTNSNNALTLYVYVTGGNSYGSWNISELRLKNVGITYNFQTNVSLPSSADNIYSSTTFDSLVAYEFRLNNVGLDFYDYIFDKHMYLFRPSSLTADRSIYLPNKSGTVALTSDISSRRYKENIIPLSEDEAKKILDVEIVNYDYKENVVDEDERYDQKGAIAEDVVNLIPNAVTYADVDGEQLPDGINYTKFIPYLIKMVQMQQKEIDELKAMIKEKS